MGREYARITFAARGRRRLPAACLILPPRSGGAMLIPSIAAAPRPYAV